MAETAKHPHIKMSHAGDKLVPFYTPDSRTCDGERLGPNTLAELNRLNDVNLDLLAACEAALWKIDDMDSWGESEARELLVAAIAKAKGETDA